MPWRARNRGHWLNDRSNGPIRESAKAAPKARCNCCGETRSPARWMTVIVGLSVGLCRVRAFGRMSGAGAAAGIQESIPSGGFGRATGTRSEPNEAAPGAGRGVRRDAGGAACKQRDVTRMRRVTRTGRPPRRVNGCSVPAQRLRCATSDDRRRAAPATPVGAPRADRHARWAEVERVNPRLSSAPKPSIVDRAMRGQASGRRVHRQKIEGTR
jgi:hypothetical protein